jgi:hypothetical protein
MKTNARTDTLRAKFAGGISSLIVSAAVLLGSGGIQAQAGYAISWSKIAGGGGTSRSAQYSLSGTLGQPDAGGPMRGGSFAITGGFWSFAAVQTPDAPRLRIFATGNGAVIVAWPAPSPGWTLEQCSDLTAPSWSAIPGTNSFVGNENQFLIPSPTGDRFFRLAHPFPQDNTSK